MMDFPADALPGVSRAARAVLQEAIDAGVWVFGEGLTSQDQTSVVGTDGVVSVGPFPGEREHLGGFSVVDVADSEEVLMWAAKIAAACRCPQEVRAFMPENCC